jgi:hypothetical protein
MRSGAILLTLSILSGAAGCAGPEPTASPSASAPSSTSAMRVAAQAPGSMTAFDGQYVGVSIDPPSRRDEESNGARNRARCNTVAGVPDPLTITNGIVRSPPVDRASGSALQGSWEGTVSPQGAVVMRDGLSHRADGQIDSQGTLRVQYSGTACAAALAWRKQSG